MSVIGERQVTGGNGRESSDQEGYICQNMSEFPVLKARYQHQKAGLVGTSVGYQGQPIHSLYS